VSGVSVTNNKRKRDFGSSMVVGDQKVCGDRTEIKVYKCKLFGTPTTAQKRKRDFFRRCWS